MYLKIKAAKVQPRKTVEKRSDDHKLHDEQALNKKKTQSVLI